MASRVSRSPQEVRIGRHWITDKAGKIDVVIPLKMTLQLYDAWLNQKARRLLDYRIIEELPLGETSEVLELAMPQMTVHKTRSVFDRYSIVSKDDYIEAAAKLNAYLAESTAKDTDKVAQFRTKDQSAEAAK